MRETGRSLLPRERRQGPERAAAAAVEVARAIPDAACKAPKEIEELIEPGEEAVNVGVHWGGSLYMGQVVTRADWRSRLSERRSTSARGSKEAASGGTIYASKVLLERLEDKDAADLHIDSDNVRYVALGEMDVDEKVKRDAAAISVVDLSA